MFLRQAWFLTLLGLLVAGPLRPAQAQATDQGRVNVIVILANDKD